MRSSQEYYDDIAGEYRQMSYGKQAFLDAVDEYVIEKIGHADRYLDVGAGDGYRSVKIANRIQAEKVVLVDNSPVMISKLKPDNRITILVESIANVVTDERFDLITCLWNVLAHIGEYSDRVAAIKKISELLADDGTFVLDVNNRFNIAYYGFKEVMKNLTAELENDPKKGWFTVGAGDNLSEVYIHAPLEIDPILKDAGLYIDDLYYVDYLTGERKETFFEGQFLYFLKKNGN
jgi:SAM-dependent methyltransferase